MVRLSQRGTADVHTELGFVVYVCKQTQLVNEVPMAPQPEQYLGSQLCGLCIFVEGLLMKEPGHAARKAKRLFYKTEIKIGQSGPRSRIACA